MSAIRTPGQVIAGEEIFAAIEEDGVAPRVPRRGDHQQIVVELNGLIAGRLDLDRGGVRSDVVAMQHALAAEALVELLMIGDVVLVREQHPPRAAHPLDVLHQRRGEARRVDQKLPRHEVRHRAE